MTGRLLQPILPLCALALALAMATPAPAAAAPPAGDTLGEIVVTAATGTLSRLDSSVSASSVPAAVIDALQPQSEADLLRLLPGLQPNVTGPGGNGNFAVRGLPVTTGGAPFVQLQEDGLPVVLYGDILFGNNDYWTRFSPTDARVEAVRGGTAATLASQAPGAVVNHVSQTGRGHGGYIALDEGVNDDYARLRFLAAGGIDAATWYTIGGSADIGHGPKHAPYDVSRSWLLKGNLTHTLGDGRSTIRLLFKLAETHEPDDPGGPACGTVANGTVTSIGGCPGFDGRRQSIASRYNRTVSYVDDASGALASHPLDGIGTRQRAIQAQLHLVFGGGITLDDNARAAALSGGFGSNFYHNAPTAALIGSQINGAVVARAIAAAGPNAGRDMTDATYNDNVEVWTRIRSLNNLANDARLNWRGAAGGLAVNLTAGWFFMRQSIAADWHPGRFNATAAGVPIDLYDAAGHLLSATGITGYNDNWGPCCARDYAYSFTDNAPYADLILAARGIELDASVRHDINHGAGGGNASSGVAHSLTQVVPDPLHGGMAAVTIPYILPDGPRETIAYTLPTTSWSVGLSYKPASGLNLFARASRGVRFNADRMTFNGYFNPDGSLNATTGAAAATDTLTQVEAGLKARGDLGPTHATLELTAFASHFNITTYEISPTVCPIVTGNPTTFTCIVADRYRSLGAAAFVTLRRGGLSSVANLTWSHGQEMGTAPGAAWGRANNIPDLAFTLAVNWQASPRLAAGIDVTGASSVHGADGVVYPGASVVGANLKITPARHLELGLRVSNLFNAWAMLGGAGSTGGVRDGAFAGGAVFANGRSVTASLKITY